MPWSQHTTLRTLRPSRYTIAPASRARGTLSLVVRNFVLWSTLHFDPLIFGQTARKGRDGTDAMHKGTQRGKQGYGRTSLLSKVGVPGMMLASASGSFGLISLALSSLSLRALCTSAHPHTHMPGLAGELRHETRWGGGRRGLRLRRGHET